jgi:hypothetical protein
MLIEWAKNVAIAAIVLAETQQQWALLNISMNYCGTGISPHSR